jgi:protein O-GlcNAc transferase
MDYNHFLDRLSKEYNNGEIDLTLPQFSQFQIILDRVKGSTTASILQLLNLAVDCLGEEELYCQIGFDRGETVISSLVNHHSFSAYVVENLSHLQFGDRRFNVFLENLKLFDLEDRVYFFDQNFEDFLLELRHTESEDRIGVYFYNGAYDYRSQLMSLLLVQPCLSDRALIIINNRNFPSTQQAVWDFMAAYPQASLLLDLPTPALASPTFWNGLYVLSWDTERIYHDRLEDFPQQRNSVIISEISNLKNVGIPETPKSLYEEALHCHRQEQFLEAESKYLASLKIDPYNPKAWLNLGVLYYSTQRYDIALHSLEKYRELEDSQPDLYYNLGLVFEKLGRWQDAVDSYVRAIECDANYIDAYNNLGNIFDREGDFIKAEQIYQAAVRVNPQHFGSYLNLGNVLIARERLEEAEEVYQEALTHNPAHPDLLHNLNLIQTYQENPQQLYLDFGDLFYARGKHKIYTQYYQKIEDSILLTPEIYLRLANGYQEDRQIDRAIETLTRGIERYPFHNTISPKLINLLLNSGKIEEALAYSDLAVARDSSLVFKIQNLLWIPVLYRNISEIKLYRDRFTSGLNQLEMIPLETVENIDEAITSLFWVNTFYLGYQGYNDRALQEQYARFVQRVTSRRYPQWIAPPSLPPLTSQQKIRVGYISGNMGPRRLGELAIGWLRHCDRQQFEIYCYYLDTPIDDLTQQFQKYSDYFHQIPGSVEDISTQVISDRLHILVFIDIGIDSKITQLASLRLAPIQCTTWIHPVTSGLSTLDYFLSSELMEPDVAEDHYIEKLIALPNIGISYAAPNIPPLSKTRADFGLDDRRIVYLSCQSLFKYLPQHDYIFAEIARQVPNAQLVFLSHPNYHLTQLFQQRLQQVFASYKLNLEDYCVMLPRLNESDYISINQLSDIFLDTFSWSGGVTTLKAIACDLPVVTCPGEMMRSRHSYAILKMLGVTDTIAQTESDYIKIAVKLGLDADFRRNIVNQTIDRRSRIFDDIACVKELEKFYRQVVNER